MTHFLRLSYYDRRKVIFEELSANASRVYSVLELAKAHGVHRDTMRRTLDELCGENLIWEGRYERPGNRTFLPHWYGYHCLWMYAGVTYEAALLGKSKEEVERMINEW